MILDGIGTDPNDLTDLESATAWPIYFDFMPDKPDNAIMIFDSDGILEGRLNPTGETQEQFGIQFRTRCKPPVQLARNKIDEIRDWCENVLRETATLDAHSYLVEAIDLSSSIMRLGKDSTTQHRGFTLNATATITQET